MIVTSVGKQIRMGMIDIRNTQSRFECSPDFYFFTGEVLRSTSHLVRSRFREIPIAYYNPGSGVVDYVEYGMPKLDAFGRSVRTINVEQTNWSIGEAIEVEKEGFSIGRGVRVGDKLLNSRSNPDGETAVSSRYCIITSCVYPILGRCEIEVAILPYAFAQAVKFVIANFVFLQKTNIEVCILQESTEVSL